MNITAGMRFVITGSTAASSTGLLSLSAPQASTAAIITGVTEMLLAAPLTVTYGGLSLVNYFTMRDGGALTFAQSGVSFSAGSCSTAPGTNGISVSG